MNKSAAIALAAALVGVAMMTAASGCSIGDFVQSDVPLDARKAEGLPPRLSHNDNVVAYESWIASVENTNAQWQESISDSAYIVELGSAFTIDALQLGEGYISALPLGTLGVGALSLLGGVLLPRPGEGKAREQAREQGKRETIEATREVARAVKLTD